MTEIDDQMDGKEVNTMVLKLIAILAVGLALLQGVAYAEPGDQARDSRENVAEEAILYPWPTDIDQDSDPRVELGLDGAGGGGNADAASGEGDQGVNR